jgi:hypothetical protein
MAGNLFVTPNSFDPVEARRETNFTYRLLSWIYPAFRLPFPNLVIPADDLAMAMVQVCVQKHRKWGGPILENRDIRAMVESVLA